MSAILIYNLMICKRVCKAPELPSAGLTPSNNFEILSMKKSILAPLCSALVVPGLGQVINEQLKKGVFILSAVFILFLLTVIESYRITRSVLDKMQNNPSNPEMIMDRLGSENLSVLFFLLAVFALLWIYSVVEAYLTGRKIDRFEKGDIS